jgi:hypothetical protein
MPLSELRFEVRPDAGSTRISVGAFSEFPDVDERDFLSSVIVTVLSEHGAWPGPTDHEHPLATAWREDLREHPNSRVVNELVCRRTFLRRDAFALIELSSKAEFAALFGPIWQVERPVIMLRHARSGDALREARRLQDELLPTAEFLQTVSVLAVGFYHHAFVDFYTNAPDRVLSCLAAIARAYPVPIRRVKDVF